MTRLAIRKESLRDLAIRSKNKCAFPGCDHPILNADGVYVAELCHIEAAEPCGQRYNPNQTDEERRAPSNLLFLCHQHHKVTDDVEQYPVSRLQEVKREHEALPEVVFNSELLLKRLDEVLAEQAAIRNILRASPQPDPVNGSFPIVGPELEESWTPQEGRSYKTNTGPNTWFKYLMLEGWLHIEQRLEDGAIAYYEVNEQGSVRNSRTPYPINEYRVLIPEELILDKEKISSAVGTYAIRTTLKWSLGTVIEHYMGSVFARADCQARCVIDHRQRTIRVLGMPDA